MPFVLVPGHLEVNNASVMRTAELVNRSAGQPLVEIQPTDGRPHPVVLEGPLVRAIGALQCERFLNRVSA